MPSRPGRHFFGTSIVSRDKNVVVIVIIRIPVSKNTHLHFFFRAGNENRVISVVSKEIQQHASSRYLSHMEQIPTPSSPQGKDRKKKQIGKRRRRPPEELFLPSSHACCPARLQTGRRLPLPDIVTGVYPWLHVHAPNSPSAVSTSFDTQRRRRCVLRD